MLNWGPFMLKPRTGVLGFNIKGPQLSIKAENRGSNIVTFKPPSVGLVPPPPLPSPGRDLTSGLTCTAGPGLPGAPYFSPYNFKSEEHFSKSQGTLIYWT